MSGGGGTNTTAGRTHATFGERAIALLIDFAIFFVAAIILSIIGFVVGSISDVLGLLYTLVTWVIYIGLGFVFFAMGEGGPLGQTPGKHMRGIQVIKEDGSQLGMGGGVIRWLGRILDSIVCGLPIGYLWPLFDDEDRCWHDMVASTRVVTGGPQGSPQEWFAKFRG